jgi:hypothetical protein
MGKVIIKIPDIFLVLRFSFSLLTLSAFGIYIGRWKGGKEESNANTKQSGF